MQFYQVKPQKGSEIIMQHIMKQIASGEQPPGSRLPTVVELATNFEVGRSTVREALSALKAMGWIEIRHGGGTFVSKSPPSEEGRDTTGLLYQTESLKEVLEVRKYLEAGCAALAAQRRTEEDLFALSRIIENMNAVVTDEEQSEQADVQFHMQIAKASHNALLFQMMESITQRLHESMKEFRRLWFYAERATAERLLQEHTEIYEAIKAMDATLAAETMENHLLKVESIVQRLS